MKSLSVLKLGIVSVLLLGSVNFGQTAFGQLIAADSYNTADYSLGGLNAQNPSISPGWTGSGSDVWSVGTANLQADTISLTNVSTPYDDLSDGKGKYISSTFDAYRAGHHRIDTYTAADTYYMSFFVNPGGSFLSSGSREHAVVGFTNFFSEAAFENTSTDNVYGLFAGFHGEGAGAAIDSVDLILRARDSSGDLVDTVLIPDAIDTTYHVLYKLDVNVGGGSADDVTYWVNPTDLTSEAAMTTSAEATGLVSTFAMDTNSRIDRSFVISNNWARSFFWDETRLGYDLESVTGVSAPSAIEGDYDDSGLVSQGDLDQVLLNWGTANFPGNEAALPDGGPFDGAISQNELDGVLLNWGNTSLATAAAVPEPTSLMLVLLSCLGVGCRPRKKV